MNSYTEEQKEQFVALAQEIGINRARRELGYPSAWIVGHNWCENAGVVIALDELKQRAARHQQFYTDSELLLALQDSIERVMELMANPKLSPTELEKLTTLIKKAPGTIRSIQGKDAKADTQTDKILEVLLSTFEETVKSD